MAICNCGCGLKVKFGRGYLNSRSLELRAISEFGFLIEQTLPTRPIPNTPSSERDRVRNHLKGLAVFCLAYSDSLHSYSLGHTSESQSSDVLGNRQKVFNDEVALIDAVCYCSAFCLLNGSLTENEFRAEVQKLSTGQRAKVRISMNLVRQMANEEERKVLPQL